MLIFRGVQLYSWGWLFMYVDPKCPSLLGSMLSFWVCIFEPFMAGQPTPPGHVPLPEIAGLIEPLLTIGFP